MYELKISDKCQKSINSLLKTNPKLVAELTRKIDLMKNGYESLNIKPIKRKNAKHNIQELVIRNPVNTRLFFIDVLIDDKNNIILLDCRKKKCDKFPPKYYRSLDKIADKFL